MTAFRTIAATVLIGMLCWISSAIADATILTADVKGSGDHPSLNRFDGSMIVSFERKKFDEFNNLVYQPSSKIELEGEYRRIVYLMPVE